MVIFLNDYFKSWKIFRWDREGVRLYNLVRVGFIVKVIFKERFEGSRGNIY